MYGLVDVEIVDTDNDSRFCGIYNYCRSISSICNEEGKAHYRELCKLVNRIFSLSHMNEYRKRGLFFAKQHPHDETHLDAMWGLI